MISLIYIETLSQQNKPQENQQKTVKEATNIVIARNFSLSIL